MTKDEMIEFYKSFIPRLTSEILNLQKSLEDLKRTAEYWERAYNLSRPSQHESSEYNFGIKMPIQIKEYHKEQLDLYKDKFEQL